MGNGKTARKPRPTPTRKAAAPGGGDGEYKIEPQRILEKVAQDPTGGLMVQAAMQQCVIEDQHKVLEDQKKTIEEMQAKLVEVTANQAGEG